MEIEDSTDVALQGFTITGGDIGVRCFNFSVCRFKNNTIQNATDVVGGAGYGVAVVQSRASFDGDIIQNNAERGLNIGNGSVSATNINVNNNGIVGVIVADGGFFGGDPANIHNNGGVGVRVTGHSTFRLRAGAITGNTFAGVRVDNASEASFTSFDGPITISGNGANGVQIHDLSFAFFVNGGPAPPLNVTGNTPLDVNCFQLPFAARGATTDISGGTTNCTEPQ